MSSSTLATIQSQLNLYGFSVSMILGHIGNIFIVIIFSQQRQNACSIYLITSAITNDLFLILNGCTQIIPFNYSIQTPAAFAFCKIRLYIAGILGQLAKTMLVLACIDRYLITSNRVSFRALSTPIRAKWLIIFSFIFWSLAALHLPILSTITNGFCGAAGAYSTVFAFYSVIVVGLIPPITMGIFGYLTYRNMKQRNVRVEPSVVDNTTNANTIIRRRDRYFIIIIISEVFVYVVTAPAVPVVLLEMKISQYILSSKSVQQIQIEGFIFTVAFLLYLTNSATSFYIYLVSSKSFRHEFKQLIINAYGKLRRLWIALAVP